MLNNNLFNKVNSYCLYWAFNLYIFLHTYVGQDGGIYKVLFYII